MRTDFSEIIERQNRESEERRQEILKKRTSRLRKVNVGATVDVYVKRMIRDISIDEEIPVSHVVKKALKEYIENHHADYIDIYPDEFDRLKGKEE